MGMPNALQSPLRLFAGSLSMSRPAPYPSGPGEG
jgi:hypothetical protein